MLNLIKKITCCHGLSGSEKPVSEVIRGAISPYVDECYNDTLGNLIAMKAGAGEERRKIMLCAHMDEIGYMVTCIEDNGNIRFSNIGGINYIAAAYTGVVSGRGVPGVLVPEGGLKAGEITLDKCYIDIGAKNKKEAERLVSVGDAFVQEPYVKKLAGRRIAGRPFDDRLGCAILVMIAERLAEADCPDDIYYVFSVQEEVGCRGSKPAAFEISPDLALVYDVTSTGDTPGAKPMAVRLGEGAAIKIKDASVICHAGMVEELIKVAKENKIKYQCEILVAGGTDTSSIQMSGAGCRAAALSIPTRYIHSGVELADLGDIRATVELSVKYLLSREGR
ncbi:MAG TPA: M42 family metallopeptidase [Clostridiales bacterium]|jgi:putative aminopeptidase FrvX|nr:M42 family metallopeptidase [Clostridiales bacterium]